MLNYQNCCAQNRSKSNPKQKKRASSFHQNQQYQDQLDLQLQQQSQSYLKGRSTYTELFSMKKSQEQLKETVNQLKQKLNFQKVHIQEQKQDQYQLSEMNLNLKQIVKKLKERLKMYEEKEQKYKLQFQDLQDENQRLENKYKKGNQLMDQSIQIKSNQQINKLQKIVEKQQERNDLLEKQIQEIKIKFQTYKENQADKENIVHNKRSYRVNKETLNKNDFSFQQDKSDKYNDNLIHKYSRGRNQNLSVDLVDKINKKISDHNFQDLQDHDDFHEMKQMERHLQNSKYDSFMDNCQTLKENINMQNKFNTRKGINQNTFNL